MPTIKFLLTSSLPNKVTKTFTTVRSYPNAQIPHQVNDDSIQVKVAVDASVLNPKACNYMSVDDDRYYFVTSVDADANGGCTVHGTLDPLMTYRTAILSTTVLLNRSTSAGSPAILDALRRVSAAKNRTVLSFPKEISEEEADGLYILATSQDKYATS